MNSQKKIILILTLVSMFWLTACSEDSTSPNTEDLSDLLAKVSEDSKLPGFTISVIKNGETVKNESYGFSNTEEGTPYSSQTRQSVASVSKVFLGVAVTKAIEIGYFTLDTDINDILPFEVVNPNYPSAPITVKQLVTHTSGLLDDPEFFFAAYSILPGENISSDIAQYMINQMNMSTGETFDLGDLLEAYFASDGTYYEAEHFSNSAPGTVYSYSNLASSLAAYLIEIKSGMPYMDFVENQIFNPLGMNNTSYYYESNPNSDLYAKLYFNYDVEYPAYISASYPSGSVITTQEDLTKFMTEIINGYRGNSSTLLNKQSYNLMFSKLYKDESTQIEHGIFWFIDGNILHHEGTDLGTVAKIHINKDTNSGFIFMTNSEVQLSDEAANNLDDVNTILYALIDYLN